MSGVKKNVMGFIFVAFLLIGALFGMQIMTFIFAQVGDANLNTISDQTLTVVNRTGAYINTTLYTIPEASNGNYLGSFAVTLAMNSTDNSTINAGNYTVDATAGTITNATAATYDVVTITYTYLAKTAVRESSEAVNNNSLQAIETYTEQADTQLNSVAITITLLILIALFLVFWVIFIKPSGKKQTGGNFR